jgi:hypothetical protein
MLNLNEIFCMKSKSVENLETSKVFDFGKNVFLKVLMKFGRNYCHFE